MSDPFVVAVALSVAFVVVVGVADAESRTAARRIQRTDRRLSFPRASRDCCWLLCRACTSGVDAICARSASLIVKNKRV